MRTSDACVTKRLLQHTSNGMNKMYARALEIARNKISGGVNSPYFKKPYLDAAFNGNIFQWDTCFIASWAKYHIKELPIEQALDNFYSLQSPDGFICREYTIKGELIWDKKHPLSINPPLFSFAELELFSQSDNIKRLRRVYPNLRRYHAFLNKQYKMPDGLFFSDALGSGMDNIPRYPAGWKDDRKGIKAVPLIKAYKELYEMKSAKWNIQGRSFDFTAQMAFDALCLGEIAGLIGENKDIPGYEKEHAEIKEKVNELCWDEKAGFYFDLGYGKKIKRFHIGAYWAFLADIAPKERQRKLIKHLKDKNKFNRPVPVPCLAYDEKEYRGWGKYWLGGVWAPTNYMVLRGLDKIGEKALARSIAKRFYKAVEYVFEKTGTFWENYAPEFTSYGAPARHDFCGWTALAPISIYREYIK